MYMYTCYSVGQAATDCAHVRDNVPGLGGGRKQFTMYKVVLLCACVLVTNAGIQDLTHIVDQNSKGGPMMKRFNLTLDYKGTDWGFWVEYNSIATGEHIGTHIDAPRHFVENGQTMEQIPIEKLVGPAVVMDIRSRVQVKSNAELMISDVEAWEENYRKINEDDIVLVLSGWDRYYDNATAYFGTPNLTDYNSFNYPGVHPDVARLLANVRKIAGLGVDWPSPDKGTNGVIPASENLFIVHRIIQPKGVFIIENVANLDKIPRDGATVVVGAIKTRGGSGGPVRLVAMWGDAWGPPVSQATLLSLSVVLSSAILVAWLC